MSAHRGNENPKYKHGMTSSPEYVSWQNMIQRTTNPNCPRFEDWGGRGIVPCTEWKQFENFFSDMGNKPTPNHTLERIDNKLGYSKDNCRWATSKEQGFNRRSNRQLTANGYTFTMAQWCEELSINKVTLSSRLRRGWSIEEALFGKSHV